MPMANLTLDAWIYREVSCSLRSKGGQQWGRKYLKPIAVSCSLCLLLAAGPVNGADCENWNTKEFFETATPKAVTDCLHARADLNARTKDGATPMHWSAAGTQNPAVIAALINAGADPNTRTREGGTSGHTGGMLPAPIRVVATPTIVGLRLS